MLAIVCSCKNQSKRKHGVGARNWSVRLDIGGKIDIHCPAPSLIGNNFAAVCVRTRPNIRNSAHVVKS